MRTHALVLVVVAAAVAACTPPRRTETTRAHDDPAPAGGEAEPYDEPAHAVDAWLRRALAVEAWSTPLDEFMRRTPELAAVLARAPRATCGQGVCTKTIALDCGGIESESAALHVRVSSTQGQVDEIDLSLRGEAAAIWRQCTDNDATDATPFALDALHAALARITGGSLRRTPPALQSGGHHADVVWSDLVGCNASGCMQVDGYLAANERGVVGLRIHPVSADELAAYVPSPAATDPVPGAPAVRTELPPWSPRIRWRVPLEIAGIDHRYVVALVRTNTSDDRFVGTQTHCQTPCRLHLARGRWRVVATRGSTTIRRELWIERATRLTVHPPASRAGVYTMLGIGSGLFVTGAIAAFGIVMASGGRPEAWSVVTTAGFSASGVGFLVGAGVWRALANGGIRSEP